MAYAYATVDDLKARYRTQLLGQLATDTPGSAIAAGSLNSNTRIQSVLFDAAAQMTQAFYTAQRYPTDTIAAFQVTDVSTGNGIDAGLIRLNCDLAVGLLYECVGVGIPDEHKYVVTSAREAVIRIGKGELTLPVLANSEAGVGFVERPLTVNRIQYPSMATTPYFPVITDFQLPNSGTPS